MLNILISGLVPFSHMGVEEHLPLNSFGKNCVRCFLLLYANKPRHAAKTPVWLAVSNQIADKKVHGEYWRPDWALWDLRYRGCYPPYLRAYVLDRKAHRRCWEFSERAVAKACGEQLPRDDNPPLDRGWVLVERADEVDHYREEAFSPPPTLYEYQ